MSKIFITVMRMVMKTATTVLQICGTITWKNARRSSAQPLRDASMVSSGTPLIAADSSTIAKPAFIQTTTTMISRLLSLPLSMVSHGMGSPRVTPVHMALSRPTCA